MSNDSNFFRELHPQLRFRLLDYHLRAKHMIRYAKHVHSHIKKCSHAEN